MELLKTITPVKLQSFFIPAEQFILEPYGQTSTKSIHIIDGTRKRVRHELILNIIIQFINSNCGTVILYDLDFTWTSKTHNYELLKAKVGSHINRVIIRRVKNMNDLIKSLKATQSFQLEDEIDQSIPLGLVILDNISIFHWSMVESTNFPMEYRALNKVLNSLQLQFNCSMVTTSLDKKFETGVLNVIKDTDQWKNVSQLPSELVVDKSVYYITGKNRHTGQLNMKVFKNFQLVSVMKNYDNPISL